MNRTLRRPMFRMGGSTGEGITSGLDMPKTNASRQGYEPGGNVMPESDSYKSPLGLKFTEMDLNGLQSTGNKAVGGTSLEDAIAMARAKSGELSQMDPMSGREMAARFLIPFGLDFATRAPTGNLLSTAAASAKEPVDMLIKSMDARRDLATEKESDLFNTFLSAGLEDRRFERKQAAEKLKESKELLTLYDKQKKTNVIVKAGDVYKNLENYVPAKTDKNGRPFEKIEVTNQIFNTMGKIFELQNKKERTIEEEQELKEAQTVLDYLKESKNTKGFADCDLTGKRILGGSDPVSWEMIEAFVSKGAIVQPNWGMSEIGPITINMEFDSMDKVQYVKQKAPDGYTIMGDTFYCDWKIVKHELYVKGSTSIYDDWHATGDLVSLDMGRRMYYLGRN